MKKERMYPEITPIRIGIMPINPRPRIVARMVTIRVNIEMIIAVVLLMPCTGSMKPDMFIASGASSRPMMATMEPMAAGGKRTSTHFVPTSLTRNARIIKQRPKAIKPPCASA